MELEEISFDYVLAPGDLSLQNKNSSAISDADILVSVQNQFADSVTPKQEINTSNDIKKEPIVSVQSQFVDSVTLDQEINTSNVITRYRCPKERRYKEYLKTPDCNVLPRAHSKAGFTCKICFRTFNMFSSFLSHNKIHTNVKRSFPNCSYNETFNSQERCNGQTSICSDDETLTCGLCHTQFSEKDKLGNHICVATIAADKKAFSCNVCNKEFGRAQELATHDTKVHKMARNEKIFSCNVCNRRFTEKYRLFRHNFIHTKVSCDVCGRCFVGKKNLKRHALLEHKNK